MFGELVEAHLLDFKVGGGGKGLGAHRCNLFVLNKCIHLYRISEC
jgi:hypothetical protein